MPMNPWIEKLIIPLLISVGVVVFTAWFYHLGPFAQSPEKTELSYMIEPPLRILGENDRLEANITINNRIVRSLYAQPVCVWNSGQKSIDNLDLSYSFANDKLDKDFNIIDMIHNTSPSIGFGHITITDKTSISREVNYSLLNPKSNSNDADHFEALFLINRLYPIEVKSRTSNLPANPVDNTAACPCNLQS